MALDDELDGRMSRRSFLEGVGKAALGLGVVGLGGCKSPAGPSEPEPEVPVVLTANFYNHTKGYIGSKDYSGVSGDSLVIKVSDCPDVSGVDDNRIAVRYGTSDNKLGELVGFSRSGEVGSVFPGRDSSFDVFLMNVGPTLDGHYGRMDEWIDKGAGKLQYKPFVEWNREDRDGASGPEGPINTAVADLNDALDYSWKRYGRLVKVGSGGKFGVGYAYVDGAAGYHSVDFAGVDPDSCRSDVLRTRVFIEEIFELIARVDGLNADGTTGSYRLLTDRYTGHLNEVGRDLFAYAHVKDEKVA